MSIYQSWICQLRRTRVNLSWPIKCFFFHILEAGHSKYLVSVNPTALGACLMFYQDNFKVPGSNQWGSSAERWHKSRQLKLNVSTFSPRLALDMWARRKLSTESDTSESWTGSKTTAGQLKFAVKYVSLRSKTGEAQQKRHKTASLPERDSPVDTAFFPL